MIFGFSTQKIRYLDGELFFFGFSPPPNQGKLGGEKAKIVEWHARHYVPEAELRRDITDQNPAPTDLSIVPDIDP